MDTLVIHSFVIRLWMENSQAAMSEWRGSILHVETNRRIFFRDLNDIPLFIESVRSQPFIPTPEADVGESLPPEEPESDPGSGSRS